MKKLLLLSALFIFACSIDLCAQSMVEITEEARLQFQRADKDLNTAYLDLKMKYKNYPNFIEKLKIAQRLWIKYRDALIDMQFPSNEPRLAYGSMYSLCMLDFKTELTLKRTYELLNYMNNGDGDDCGGPVY